uniref:Uncharacterized protein n=1 Tax=uncultured Desulfobacterium sp. TaxID=201089 RepID=E1Y9W6_9BACT|nr:unknown protein [uncultured Desulfobacterium sp.]
MPLKSKPVFRKVVYHFYDTETAGIILIILMMPVILFGITGIVVAIDNPQYSGYIWVPVLVVCLSSVVFLSELIRFIKHSINRGL